MAFVQIPHVGRVSTSVVLGAFSILLFEAMVGPLVSPLIKQIGDIVPSIKLFSASKEDFSYIYFMVSSWMFGEFLIRFVELVGYYEWKNTKTVIGFIADRNKKMGIIAWLIHRPAFRLPYRPNLAAELSDAAAVYGKSFKNIVEWKDEDLERCFELAEFSVSKHKWMRDAINNYGTYANMSVAIGISMLCSSLLGAVNFLKNEQSIPLIFAKITIFVLPMLLFGCFFIRIYMYLLGRKIIQLFVWFGLEANAKARRDKRRSRKRSDPVQASIEQNSSS